MSRVHPLLLPKPRYEPLPTRHTDGAGVGRERGVLCVSCVGRWTFNVCARCYRCCLEAGHPLSPGAGL